MRNQIIGLKFNTHSNFLLPWNNILILENFEIYDLPLVECHIWFTRVPWSIIWSMFIFNCMGSLQNWIVRICCRYNWGNRHQSQTHILSCGSDKYSLIFSLYEIQGKLAPKYHIIILFYCSTLTWNTILSISLFYTCNSTE